jgi:hypothetical protein
MLQILAEASTYCEANGGDPKYDGGCARAVAYSQAYAKAQAEAISVAFVDYTYGKDSRCHCDVAVEVQTEAIAHELETIFAFYKTEVEARSCNPDYYGSADYAYIKQTCWAGAFADMTVKVRVGFAAPVNCQCCPRRRPLPRALLAKLYVCSAAVCAPLRQGLCARRAAYNCCVCRRRTCDSRCERARR